jgi:hypothetical protein
MQWSEAELIMDLRVTGHWVKIRSQDQVQAANGKNKGEVGAGRMPVMGADEGRRAAMVRADPPGLTGRPEAGPPDGLAMRNSPGRMTMGCGTQGPAASRSRSAVTARSRPPGGRSR